MLSCLSTAAVFPCLNYSGQPCCACRLCCGTGVGSSEAAQAQPLICCIIQPGPLLRGALLPKSSTSPLPLYPSGQGGCHVEFPLTGHSSHCKQHPFRLVLNLRSCPGLFQAGSHTLHNLKYFLHSVIVQVPFTPTPRVFHAAFPSANQRPAQQTMILLYLQQNYYNILQKAMKSNYFEKQDKKLNQPKTVVWLLLQVHFHELYIQRPPTSSSSIP